MKPRTVLTCLASLTGSLLVWDLFQDRPDESVRRSKIIRITGCGKTQILGIILQARSWAMVRAEGA